MTAEVENPGVATEEVKIEDKNEEGTNFILVTVQIPSILSFKMASKQ